MKLLPIVLRHGYTHDAIDGEGVALYLPMTEQAKVEGNRLLPSKAHFELVAVSHDGYQAIFPAYSGFRVSIDMDGDWALLPLKEPA